MILSVITNNTKVGENMNEYDGEKKDETTHAMGAGTALLAHGMGIHHERGQAASALSTASHIIFQLSRSSSSPHRLPPSPTPQKQRKKKNMHPISTSTSISSSYAVRLHTYYKCTSTLLASPELVDPHLHAHPRVGFFPALFPNIADSLTRR